MSADNTICILETAGPQFRVAETGFSGISVPVAELDLMYLVATFKDKRVFDSLKDARYSAQAIELVADLDGFVEYGITHVQLLDWTFPADNNAISDLVAKELAKKLDKVGLLKPIENHERLCGFTMQRIAVIVHEVLTEAEQLFPGLIPKVELQAPPELIPVIQEKYDAAIRERHGYEAPVRRPRSTAGGRMRPGYAPQSQAKGLRHRDKRPPR